ncbi:BspA family leucine-rich repeat surface protein [Winogradskyella sp.]|uniref:BspA family leucine-rich repeat surface protein n=1 Tax=Winogradskyella sp. TaxID=1883156 RepID=UPI003BA8D227
MRIVFLKPCFRLAALLSIGLLITNNLAAQCNDIAQVLAGPRKTTAAPATQGQWFTPQCTGTIQSISFSTDYAPITTSQARFRLFRASGGSTFTFLRNITFTIHQETSQRRSYTIDLDDVDVTAGDQLVFSVSNAEGANLTEFFGNFYPFGAMVEGSDLNDDQQPLRDLRFTVDYKDTVAPTAICQNITVALDANGTASITADDIDGGSFDNLDGGSGIASLSIPPTTFDCSNLGSDNVVTLTVTDNEGNQSTCDATITIIDNTGPVISGATDDITVNTDLGGCTAVVNYADVHTVSATDACGATSTITISGGDSGSAFPIGTTTVTYTATDDSGNTSQRSFNITVVDAQPNAVCQDFAIASNAGGSTTSVPTDFLFIPQANYGDVTFLLDGTAFNADITSEDPSDILRGSSDTWNYEEFAFTVPSDGLYTFTLSGDSGSNLIIWDAPIVPNSGPFFNRDEYVGNVTYAANGSVTLSSGTATPNSGLFDLDAGVLYYMSIIGLDPGDFFSGTLQVDTSINGSLSQTYDCSSVGTAKTLRIIDQCGRETSCTANIIDDTPPVVNGIISDINVNVDPGKCTALVDFDVHTISVTDNCTPTPTISTNGGDSGTEFQIGSTTVTYMVTDDSGNTAETSFVVTVTDQPFAICQDPTITLDGTVNRIAPSDIFAGDLINYGDIDVLMDGTHFNTEITTASPTDDFGDGVTPNIYSYQEFVFQAPVSGNFTFNLSGNTTTDLAIVLWDAPIIPFSGEFTSRDEYMGLVVYRSDGTIPNADGTVQPNTGTFALSANTRYLMSIVRLGPISDGDFEGVLQVDTIINGSLSQPLDCPLFGTLTKTLTVYDECGRVASCTSNATIINNICSGTVPDIIGETQADAEAAIIAADFTVGTVTQEFSISCPIGEVIVQTPTGGTQMLAGQAIDFTVCAGPDPDAFITKWQTNSDSQEITIPLVINSGSLTIEWGDGMVETVSENNPSHTYTTAGEYLVSVSGNISFIRFNNLGDRTNILEVTQWGTSQWTSFQDAFYGCENLVVTATDAPDLTNTTSFQDTFRGLLSTTQNIEHWDMSTVRQTNGTFRDSGFNGDISGWYTGNIKNMDAMFANAPNFNQDISGWDVSSLERTVSMFNGAVSFDQDLGAWNISVLDTATNMFTGVALSVQNYDSLLIGWSSLDANQTTIPSNVNFSGGNSPYCFGESSRNILTGLGWNITDGGKGCDPFTTKWNIDSSDELVLPIDAGNNGYRIDWGDGTIESNTNNHTYAEVGVYEVQIAGNLETFNMATAGFNTARKLLEVSHWGSSAWTSFNNAFFGCENMDVTATDAPDLSNVTSLRGMFNQCRSLVGTAAFSSWDLSNVTDISFMFNNAELFNQDIGVWNVGNVTNMSNTFSATETFNQDLNTWDMSSVQIAEYMFAEAETFNGDIGNWNLESLEYAKGMFIDAHVFNQDINWTLGSLIDAHDMFRDALSFNGNLSALNMSTVEDFSGMFFNALVFNQDISTWDLSSAQNISSMFRNAQAFNQYIGDWNVGNVTAMIHTFDDATAFNQDIGDWNVANVTSMEGMFNGAVSFDQDLGAWNISVLETASDMFLGVALSVQNYDDLLIGWSTLDAGENAIPNNVSFSGGNSQYCLGESGRDILTDLGWNITDEGRSCDPFFVTKWNIDSSDALVLPIDADNNGYRIDWGDGIVENNTNNHTYANAGVYEVKIEGHLQTFNMSVASSGNRLRLLEVSNWGLSVWTSFDSAFSGCENMDVTATDAPDLSNVTSLNGMFNQCFSLVGTATFSNWDLSNVTDIGSMFNKAILFNQDISDWNVSNVTTMASTFEGAQTFNQDLNWTLGSLIDASNMFREVTSFNGDLSALNMSTVEDFSEMFRSAQAFDQDLSTWDLSSAQNLTGMFRNALAFNGDIGNWNVSNVTNMESMFLGATAFNQDIGAWNVGNVTSMSGMFLGATAFNQDLNNWDMSNVERTEYMFALTEEFNGAIGNWTLESLENAEGMFRDAAAFNQDLNNWTLGSLVRTKEMFREATAFNGDIRNWDTSTVNVMASMFEGATAFNQDISGWNTGNVENMVSMFEGATAFDQDLGGWDISTLTLASHMFAGASLSSANYDALLIGWQTDDSGVAGDGDDDVPTNIAFHGGNSQYCLGESARNILTGLGWNIADGGRNCDRFSFITKWNIDSSDELVLPINADNNGYVIDWGDGTIENNTNNHTYANVGVYEVKIEGNLQTFNVSTTSINTARKLLEVSQWGSSAWTSFFVAFSFCENMDVTATDVPDLSNVTSLNGMFNQCYSLVGTPAFSSWDLSNVEDIGSMFNNAQLFNQDIGTWNVSNITNMAGTFEGAHVFNQDLNTWDMSSVQTADYMFEDAFAFNGDVSSWNLESLINAEGMFSSAQAFNQDLNWTLGSLIDASNMFSGAVAFDGDLSALNMSTVEDFSGMFRATLAFNQDISIWDLSSAQNLTEMFRDAIAFNQDIDSWNVSNVTAMEGMFRGATLFNQDLNTWVVDNLETTRDMFRDATSFNRDIGNWNTSNIINMRGMFRGATLFNQDLNTWDMSNVETTQEMFRETTAFNGAIDNWTLESLINAEAMFKEATAFNQNLNNWTLGSLVRTREMFQGATAFNGDISNWNTSAVNTMALMFEGATSFNQDITGWNTGNVESLNSMFEGATAFNQDIGGWDLSSLERTDNMFNGATAFDQDLGDWDISELYDARDMFEGTSLSTANYDALLIGWQTDDSGVAGDGDDDVPPAILFGGGNSQYCLGATARQDLIDTYSWTMVDGGLNCLMTITLSPKVYLQGPSLNPNAGEETLMRDDLRANSLLPFTSPYSDGLIADGSVFSVVGNEAIVDWVWVELRDNDDNTIVVDSQSALLQRDGDVVDIDGTSPLRFDQSQGSYYVAVNHRNHIGIISGSAIFLSSAAITVDLASDANTVEGGTNAVLALANGKYGMYTGDYDGNAQIQNTDATTVVQLIGSSGYDEADMDINTQVQNTDVNALINPNIGRGEQFGRPPAGVLSTDVTLSFANAQITNDGTDDYYEADIMIESTTGFYVGSGQVYVDYNTSAFGENVSANAAIEYSQPVGSILGYEFSGVPFATPAYKDFIQNDNTTSRVSLSFQQNVALVGLEFAPELEVVPTAKVLFHIKIRYADATADAAICFYNDGVFQDQFFTACGGTSIADCTNAPGTQITNDTYDCTGADVSTLSLMEFNNDTIVLHPNPVRTSFYIKGLEAVRELRVYDINGRIILERKGVEEDQPIDMSGYDDGVYLVEITNENRSAIKRLIKKSN